MRVLAVVDPNNPACVEIGIYRDLIKSPAAKQNCIEMVRRMLSAAGDKAVLSQFDLAKDTKNQDGLTFEITPETAPDAYEGWWSSVYDEQMLDQMRATGEDLKCITVTANEVKSAPTVASAAESSTWTSTQIATSRGQDTAASKPVYIPNYSAKTTYVGPRGGEVPPKN